MHRRLFSVSLMDFTGLGFMPHVPGTSIYFQKVTYVPKSFFEGVLEPPGPGKADFRLKVRGSRES